MVFVAYHQADVPAADTLVQRLRSLGELQADDAVAVLAGGYDRVSPPFGNRPRQVPLSAERDLGRLGGRGLRCLTAKVEVLYPPRRCGPGYRSHVERGLDSVEDERYARSGTPVPFPVKSLDLCGTKLFQDAPTAAGLPPLRTARSL